MTYVDAIQCASDESIETYSLGRVIDEIELAAIEEHLFVCQKADYVYPLARVTRRARNVRSEFCESAIGTANARRVQDTDPANRGLHA